MVNKKPPEIKKSRTVIFRLNEALYDDLSRICKRSEKSLSEVVRTGIELLKMKQTGLI